MPQLPTRWSASALAGNTLQEYPRPQLQRESWLCLNGTYEYAITAAGAQIPQQFAGEILVPFAPQTLLSGVKTALSAQQWLWYRRSFTVPQSFAGQRILLHFGAVDWQCEVFLNRHSIGTHTGGYHAFSFDITDALIAGENELIVRVYDPTDAGEQPRGKQKNEPGGLWYTPTSGIWQTVWLEPVAPCHVQSLRMTPDIDTGALHLETSLCGGQDAVLFATVSAAGKQVFCGEIVADTRIVLPNTRLWSPEDPFLYDLQLEVRQNGQVVDCVTSYFGMRKFSIGKDNLGIPRLFLNNAPYFQKGLLDQGYWSDGGLTPPSDEAMIYDIETMKALGFNMLRKHIKVEPMRWYYHCDRLGMIVWQDMVSGGADYSLLVVGVLPQGGIHLRDNRYDLFRRKDPAVREAFEHDLYEMIAQLYNCVSIGCWVPFNEAWGQFDAKRIGQEVAQHDPSRIVDHASGWHDQGGRDLKSVHKYILPVRLPKADGRPFALTEYGGYSYIADGHVWNKKKSFGYQMYKSNQTLSAAYRRLHEKQILPLIKKGLSATVYTQVSDVETEVNGILTYDRESIKIDEAMLREINARMTL